MECLIKTCCYPAMAMAAIRDKNSTAISDGAVCQLEPLVPAESLAQDPERGRNGYKEQTETYRTTPAEPRTPCTPVFQTAFMVVVILFLVVLDTFALVLHIVSLCYLMRACCSRKSSTTPFGAQTDSFALVVLYVRPCCSPK